MYIQRYIEHFPASGEIVLFDRSWYNRAGVEHVLGYCTDEQYKTFLQITPAVERAIINSGITLIKYWLEVSRNEQTRRFEERITDGRKTWKLSPQDLEAHRRWYDYSRARDAMFEATDTHDAPWHVLRSDNKRTARRKFVQLLSLIPNGRWASVAAQAPGLRAMSSRTGEAIPFRDVIRLPLRLFGGEKTIGHGCDVLELENVMGSTATTWG
jgi:hypothetical protein